MLSLFFGHFIAKLCGSQDLGYILRLNLKYQLHLLNEKTIFIILRFDLDLNTSQVTVRAIRFYKTDYLMCAIRCPYKERGIGCFSTDHQPSSFMLFPAKLVDDTTCECDLKHMSKVNRPMPYDLTVLFEPLSSTSIPGFVQSAVSYRNACMLHVFDYSTLRL